MGLDMPSSTIRGRRRNAGPRDRQANDGHRISVTGSPCASSAPEPRARSRCTIESLDLGTGDPRYRERALVVLDALSGADAILLRTAQQIEHLLR